MFKGEKNGYTIVELLIVISILALFAAFGFANFRGFSQRQEVANSTEQVISDLRFAQSQALAGTKPTSCTGDLQGYRFAVTGSSPPSYAISAVCDNTVLVKTALLPATINLTTGSPILFMTVGHGTDILPGGSVTISISGELQSVPSQSVIVNSNGEIRQGT